MGELDNNNLDNNLEQQGQEIQDTQQPQQPQESQVNQDQAVNKESKQPDYAQMQEQALQMEKQAEEMSKQAEQLQHQAQQQAPQQQQQQYQQPRPDQYQQPQYQYQQKQEPKSNGLAIASLVLGIISFFALCLPVIPALTAIVGLILGIISLVKGKGGKGMAIAGVILSGLSLLIAVLFIIGLMSFFTNESIMSEIRDQMQYEFDYNMWDSY